MSDHHNLRVALIAGSLVQGGAEKQLVYLARELARAGVDVQVFAVTRGEFYEPRLTQARVPVEWVGRWGLPPLRAADLAIGIRQFRPHIVQAAHFFTNLYAVAAARLCGCAELGTIRNDTRFDMASCGRWGHALLRTPRTLVANSRTAARNAEAAGVDAVRLELLTNVIDLAEFDAASGPRRTAASHVPGAELLAIAVARLVPAKRLDRFVGALARARQRGARVRGLIVGDGPEREPLEALARTQGLMPDGVAFVGARPDVPKLLAHADVFVLTSQHEGFPNVLLEAMAASLPVITTPAGDAAHLVDAGRTGYVVPFDDEDALATRLTDLAQSPATRQAFGLAGRTIVVEQYQADTLARRAIQLYQRAARQQRSAKAMHAIDAVAR